MSNIIDSMDNIRRNLFDTIESVIWKLFVLWKFCMTIFYIESDQHSFVNLKLGLYFHNNLAICAMSAILLLG